MPKEKIIIAGGGIAGLAAAIALQGREVTVLERAHAFEEVGAGLQLGPNAVAALKALGAWEAVEPITNRPPEIHMRDGVTGRLLKRLKLGKEFVARYGEPYRTALRADLHGALLRVAQSSPTLDLKLGTKVQRVENQIQDVEVICEEGRFKAAALIATDGVNSLLRQQLAPNSQALDSGHVFHRVLLRTLSPIAGVDFSCVNLWMLPGGHVVHYPVGINEAINLVAITPQGELPNQTFRQACAGLSDILDHLPPSTPWPGRFVPPLRHWNYGSVLLMGDAAHASVPYLAQGAAMALEDASVLKQVLRDSRELPAVFAKVSELRRARTARLQGASIAAGRTYHRHGVQRHLRNLGLPVLPQTAIWLSLNWLYRWSPELHVFTKP